MPSVALFQDPRELARKAVFDFEAFRRRNLETHRGRNYRGRCVEPVGNVCYEYDPEHVPPATRPEVFIARDKLIAYLDSLGTAHPGDNFISGQRVRYLLEADRRDRAHAVATTCASVGWWCDALTGLTLHQLGRYRESEASFEKVLAALSPREHCTWLDLTPYLDEDTRRQYIRTTCGTPERAAFEARVWWFARTRYGLDGNDSRTEHFSRLTYVEFLREAARAHYRPFEEADREVLLRFGWERTWAENPGRPIDAIRADPNYVDVVGFEPMPAHRFIPPSHVLTSPAASDSTDWAVQLPPVVARYQPEYARRLRMLEHQQALFRRGDTALVVLAYDVSREWGRDSTPLDRVPLEAALVVTPGTTPRGTITRVANAPAKGTITVRAPWGPLLMSAEVAADSVSTLVRARYGIRPPFAIGARVSLSDLLFYVPSGERPTTVEEALPHALATQRVRASQTLGVYWEAYNTNPEGERMTISLVVAPENEDDARGSRIGRALRLSRATTPVSVTVEDRSARGARVTPRALELDISTLRAGAYLVQLEIDVAGQYTIRADRRLVVTGP